jgi:hypothetical protein
VSPIHLRGAIEGALGGAPLGEQFDGKAAVTDRLPFPLPQKLA